MRADPTRRTTANQWPVTALILFSLCLLCAAKAQGQELGVWRASTYEVDLQSTAEGASLRFHGGIDWPNVTFSAKPAGTTANTLVVPLSNQSEQVAEVFLRLGDDDAASWPDHAIAASIRLEPGQSTRVLLPFQAHDARQLGMQAGPPPRGTPAGPYHRLDVPTGRLNGARAHTLVVTLWGQTGPRKLGIGEPYFAMLDWSPDATHGLIDRYGQSTRGDWPERVASDEELRQKALSHLSPTGPSVTAQDEFGGAMASPQTASGYFRLARNPASGRYVLVTPTGHDFFSLGVNAISPAEGATYVSRRESMFAELPAPSKDALANPIEGTGDDRSTNLSARHIEFDYGRWVNFYALNLTRRFGPEFEAAWRADTLNRLRAWGFNTIGNWSDKALWQARGRLPYVVSIALTGDFGHVASPLDFWGAMPDPFDSRFPGAVASSVRAATEHTRDDPYVVGDFVENELPWGDGSDVRPERRYSLALATLSLGPTSAAKVAMVEQLKARYGEIANFNSAWHLQVASWDELVKRGPSLPAPLSNETLDDLKAFTALYADRYYLAVKAGLAKEDPHHLYLGSRFAAITPEALAACVRYCDVISVNLYTTSMDLGRLDNADKPVLISEFSFGAQDRGSFSGGVIDVGSETERGRHYASFMNEASRDPRVVGAHWFEFIDEPASGRRLDGENGNFGMVSIADAPYATLVAAMQSANAQVLFALFGH
jgi:hypothetical protein